MVQQVRDIGEDFLGHFEPQCNNGTCFLRKS